MATGLLGRILLGTTPFNAQLRGREAGRRDAVQVVPQERCHQTEVLLPPNVEGDLSRILKLNVFSQMPGTEYSELAWQAVPQSSDHRSFLVWAWRGADGGRGPCIPEGRLIRLAMARRGWTCVVQPRGALANIYLRSGADRFFSYTVRGDDLAARMAHVLRSHGLPLESVCVQVVEPGAVPIRLDAPACEQRNARHPLAVACWSELPLTARLGLLPGIGRLLFERFRGPLLIALALWLGAWVAGIARDVVAVRELPALESELQALTAQGSGLRGHADDLVGRLQMWERLRTELSTEPPLGSLIAAVAPALGEDGRIHGIEMAGGVARISGLAVDATAVLASLEARTELHGARFTSDLARDPRTGLEHFSIETRWYRSRGEAGE